MSGSALFSLVVAALVTALVAGLTHFAAILILPDVATKDAYTLLAAHRKPDGVTLLPAPRPGDSLIPFRDPSAVQGICFFDLRRSPFRVRATIEEGRLLTLSFRSPDGKIFYSMTDRAALHNKIDIRLVTASQLKDVEAGDDEDEGLPEELRLRAPSVEGLLVVTALVARPSERQDVQERVKAITCAPEALPPAS